MSFTRGHEFRHFSSATWLVFWRFGCRFHLFSSPCIICLVFWVPSVTLVTSSENKPAVERRGTTFAPNTGSDSNCGSRMLDDIAKTDFLPGYEAWEANSVRPVPTAPLIRLFLLLIHFKKLGPHPRLVS